MRYEIRETLKEVGRIILILLAIAVMLWGAYLNYRVKTAIIHVGENVEVTK